MKEVKRFVFEYLDLRVSERKIRMQNTAKGIDFLGYFIKPDYVLARRAVAARFRKKIAAANENDIAGKSFQAMIRSYFGHFCHADCRTLMKKYEGYLQ